MARYSGTVIERVTAVPSNPNPNQFYLVETEGVTAFYLSDSKANLVKLNINFPDIPVGNVLSDNGTFVPITGGSGDWGSILGTLSDQTDLQTALDGKVNNTGNEVIAGTKTFSTAPIVPADAYGVGWNDKQEPATKDAVYDKIETVVAAIPSAYSDEQAQDAIGAMLDTTLEYVDATPLLRRAALTGDVSAPAGSNTTTITSGAVTLANMKNLAANSIIGNNTGSPATPLALTAAQVRTLLALVVGSDVQAWDADLDAIAAITPSNDDIVQRKAGAWVSRTIAQYWADLQSTAKTYFDTLYQAILVSGTNIKTINGSSLLGSGNLSVASLTSVVSGIYTAPRTSNTEDDEFDATSLDAKWTKTNSASLGENYDDRIRSAAFYSFSTSDTTDMSLLQTYANSGNFSLTLAFSLHFAGLISGNAPNIALQIRDAAGANIAEVQILMTGSGGPFVRSVSVVSGVFTTPTTVTLNTAVPIPNFLHIQRATNNWQCWYSYDGINWTKLGSTMPITMTVAKIGLSLGNGGGALTTKVAIHWFRRDWITL